MMEDEKQKEIKVKKMIQELLQGADENFPPIDFDMYNKLAIFLKYLTVLKNSDGKRFGASTNVQYMSFGTASFIHTIWWETN